MDAITLNEGRYINPQQMCCVISLDTINYKHYVNKWKEHGLVIDVCKGQKPRSAVIFQSNLVLINSVAAETVKDRFCACGEK